MRIMEIISGPTVNGAIVTCLETTRALCQQGHEMTLVCRPNAWIGAQLAHDDVDIVYSDLHRWPIDEIQRVAGIAREKQIDVLHTHMSSANFFGVLLRRVAGIPCVATANNRHIQLHWMFNDYVVAASDATMRFHRRFNLVRKSRIDVVHNFIDDKRFHNVPKAAGQALRHELNIDPDALLIGVVGDVLKRKGMIYLVRALPTILQSIPNTHVLSVGYHRADYLRQLNEEAQQLQVADRITYGGYRSDVVNIMSAIDVLALPTLEDNLPLAILEGMASGLPVIGTTVGGLPECVVSGETGELVPPANVEALAEALISVLSNEPLRQQYGNAGRARIRRHFSRESQVRRIETVLQRFAA
jgi:glycosyltransferase involved in cell wall biosynthesis